MFIYSMTLAAYGCLIKIASLFNHKAKLWIEGRRNIWDKIQHTLQPDEQRIWVHCASLGEFEQGRPVIEAFKKQRPDYKIVLTFFSPSGYEVRKNYSQADYIFYLPIDSATNAQKWVELINPTMAIFVKYEFWYHYLHTLKVNQIPIYSISAIFRREQLFFKWYGGFYRNVLKQVTRFFVQDESSQLLLQNIGIHEIVVSGDTRFDRVYEIAHSVIHLPNIETFCNNHFVIVAGSTWPEDERCLLSALETINLENKNWKIIIAPHEISTEKMEALLLLCKPFSTKKYSTITDESDLTNTRILLIDSIGMLSMLYSYAHLAYIGGGFGKGIHNTLEAATFGTPILFGPMYYKFKEAQDLKALGAAFEIQNQEQLVHHLRLFLGDEEFRQQAAIKSKQYVEASRGATARILESVLLDIKKGTQS